MTHTDAYPNTADVDLIDGPLAGTTITAPSRTVPPDHLLIRPTNGPGFDVLPGPHPPDDLTGWHLYGTHGITKAGVNPHYAYLGPADQPAT